MLVSLACFRRWFEIQEWNGFEKYDIIVKSLFYRKWSPEWRLHITIHWRIEIKYFDFCFHSFKNSKIEREINFSYLRHGLTLSLHFCPLDGFSRDSHGMWGFKSGTLEDWQWPFTHFLHLAYCNLLQFMGAQLHGFMGEMT